METGCMLDDILGVSLFDWSPFHSWLRSDNLLHVLHKFHDVS